MGEHDGHRARLRTRLELLLFYSVPRANTNPIAHRLLERFGSLSGVLEAPRSELLKVEGVGAASATLLSLIPPLTRRYLMDKNAMGIVLDTSEKRGAYIQPLFIGQNNEQLYLLCLDQKFKLLNCVLLAEGNLGQVMVDMRTILDITLRSNASLVILAHNHTQGFALPSDEDLQITRQIAEALKMISVTLVDHIIVARDDFTSMRDSRVGQMAFPRGGIF